MAGDFNQVEEPFAVRFLVGKRIFNGITHSGLCREMAYSGRTVAGKKRFHAFVIANVHFMETEPLPALKLPQPRLLERRIVIGIDIVDPDHVMPLSAKPL